MAQASGILSSGVPLSSVAPPNQSKSGATDLAGTRADSLPPSASAPFSVIIPGSKSHHGRHPAKTGARIGAPVNPSSANSRQGFVLRFSNGFFLNTYRDSGEGNGTWATTDLQRSKLFSIPPIGAAKILCADILPALVHA